ncbi:MAG TPA: sugar ABC transporter substrate-binding protein [Solirubrobacterales bacterium]
MQAAEAGVAEATTPVKLTVGSPVDFSKLKGKNVWFLSVTQALPLVAEISKGFEAAAKEAGLTPHIYDGKGDVNTFNQGMQTAISQGAEGIVVQAIDPSVISANLAKAKAAGIPVIDSFNTSPDGALPPGIDAHVTLDFVRDGNVMADYILEQTNCEANVQAFGSTIFQVQKDINTGVEEKLKELCTECKYAFENVDLTQLATAATPAASTAINRNPQLNFMIADSDAIGPYMATAIEESHKEIPIIGHDGVNSNLEEIREGKPQEADFAFPPNETIGWAEIDQLGRVMLGMEPTEADNIPSQMFDRETLPPHNSEMFPGYANYQAKYAKIWGVGG